MALDQTNSSNFISPAVSFVDKVRKEKRLTQKELSAKTIEIFGKKSGFSTGGVSQLLNGQIKFKEHHAKIFAAALEIDVKDIASLIKSPMTKAPETLEAYKDTLRFLFRKECGGIGSLPPPPVSSDDPAEVAKAYAAYYRQLEEEGFNML